MTDIWIREDEAAVRLQLHGWQVRELVDDRVLDAVQHVGHPLFAPGEFTISTAVVNAFKGTPKHLALLAAKKAQDASYGAALAAREALL